MLNVWISHFETHHRISEIIAVNSKHLLKIIISPLPIHLFLRIFFQKCFFYQHIITLMIFPYIVRLEDFTIVIAVEHLRHNVIHQQILVWVYHIKISEKNVGHSVGHDFLVIEFPKVQILLLSSSFNKRNRFFRRFGLFQVLRWSPNPMCLFRGVMSPCRMSVWLEDHQEGNSQLIEIEIMVAVGKLTWKFFIEFFVLEIFDRRNHGIVDWSGGTAFLKHECFRSDGIRINHK